MINMVNSNCRFKHNSNIKSAFHEEFDKDKFAPDGKSVVFIRSNFCEMYHKDFTYLADKKTKNKKTKKTQLKGTGKEFASSITFGVMHEGELYDLRIFRKNTIGISGLRSFDKQLIIDIVNRLLDYINNIDPELQIEINGDPVITLCNAKSYIDLPSTISTTTCVMVNLYRLDKIINENYKSEEYWKGGKYSSLYDGTTAYYHSRIKYGDSIHMIKFYGNGKLNVYGGSSEEVTSELIRLFSEIINSNRDYLINCESIPVRKFKEIVCVQ